MPLKNIDFFLDAIKSDAKQKAAEVEEEVKRFIEAEMEKAKDEALEESYEYIHKNVEIIRAEYSKKVSAEIIKENHRLLQLREQIFSDLKTQVTQKLMEFTATKDYEHFLKNSYKKVAEILGGDLQIYICPRDGYLKELFNNALIDGEIIIGGIKASGKEGSYSIDDTLDQRLRAAMQWFRSNSGLNI